VARRRNETARAIVDARGGRYHPAKDAGRQPSARKPESAERAYAIDPNVRACKRRNGCGAPNLPGPAVLRMTAGILVFNAIGCASGHVLDVTAVRALEGLWSVRLGRGAG
jgi:hypothetical protein